jgi:hypothetical protein
LASADHGWDHALYFEHAWAAITKLGSYAPTNTPKQLYSEDRYADIGCDRLETVKQDTYVAGKKLPDGLWNSLTSP